MRLRLHLKMSSFARIKSENKDIKMTQKHHIAKQTISNYLQSSDYKLTIYVYRYFMCLAMHYMCSDIFMRGRNLW